MNNITKNYERILTDNFDLPYSYFIKENQNGDNLFLNLMLTYKYINDDNIIKAKEILAKIGLLIDKPPFIESLIEMNRGLIIIKQGSIDKGIENLKNSIKKDIKGENKWVRIELYFALKNKVPYEAWGYLEDAIKMDPKFYWAIVEKSFELGEDINCQEIIENLTKLPNSYNDNEAFNLLGVSQVNCRQFEDAKISFEKSIKIKETSNNYFLLAQLYHEHYGEFERAEVLYLKSLKIDSLNTESINAYSWFLYDMNKNAEAEKMIISMLDIVKDQEIYNQIINFYILSNDIPKAKTYLKESVTSNGINYMNDGYQIILNIKENIDYKNIYQEYTSKYMEYDVEWLNYNIDFFLNKNK